ncbi:hypothetical protein DL93DRAFT_2089693 [Clavulina sp. PMI_390]|nr:hypothetical protein DL93DRAFT_2089693 [Clavulina sp. PMI_390]
MNLRKRFRSSAKHARGRGAVISIQTPQNTPLFACAIGSGAPSFPPFPNGANASTSANANLNNSTTSLPFPGAGAVTGNGPSPDSWARLDAIMRVAWRTGHSSFYVEKGRQVLGKSASELGLPFPEYRIEGGAFPVWLVNAPTTPLAIIAIYSGNSVDDHAMVVSTLKHFFAKSGPGATGIQIGSKDELGRSFGVGVNGVHATPGRGGGVDLNGSVVGHEDDNE